MHSNTAAVEQQRAAALAAGAVDGLSGADLGPVVDELKAFAARVRGFAAGLRDAASGALPTAAPHPGWLRSPNLLEMAEAVQDRALAAVLWLPHPAAAAELPNGQEADTTGWASRMMVPGDIGFSAAAMNAISTAVSVNSQLAGSTLELQRAADDVYRIAAGKKRAVLLLRWLKSKQNVSDLNHACKLARRPAI